MQKKIIALSILIIVVLLTLVLGFDLFFNKQGKVWIASDKKEANIYVDGKKIAMVGEKFSSILLNEGTYIIRVAKNIDNRYEYTESKEIFVGKNTSVKLNFKLEKRALGFKEDKRWKRDLEMVTDTDTNLVWQDDGEAKTTNKNYQDAKKYCENLSLGGHNEWRLPKYKELLSIVDYDRYDPAIVKVFKNITSSYYWSSSADVSDAQYAWVVYFNGGYTYYYTKISAYNVRCVKSSSQEN